MKDPLKVISEIATSITLATSCRSHDHTFIFYPYCLDVECNVRRAQVSNQYLENTYGQ